MCVRPRSLFPFVLSIFLFLRFFLLLLPSSTPPSRYSLSLFFLHSVVLITLRYYALLSLYLSRRYYLFIPRRSESGVSSRSFLLQERLFHWYLLPSPPTLFFFHLSFPISLSSLLGCNSILILIITHFLYCRSLIYGAITFVFSHNVSSLSFSLSLAPRIVATFHPHRIAQT